MTSPFPIPPSRFSLKPALRAAVLLSAASSLLLAAPAQAAIDLFIKIAGIDGSSTDKVFGPQKASDVLAWSWGVSNAGGKPAFQDFNWTQYLDASAPKSFLGVAAGTHFTNVVFTARQASANPFVFFTLKFDNVLLTSFATGGSGGEDRFTLNESLQPLDKITMTYTPQKADGTAGTPLVASWDLQAGRVAAFGGDPDALTGLFIAGPTALDLSALPINQPVPEPQRWLLLGAGLAGLVCLGRRRQTATNTLAQPA